MKQPSSQIISKYNKSAEELNYKCAKKDKSKSDNNKIYVDEFEKLAALYKGKSGKNDSFREMTYTRIAKRLMNCHTIKTEADIYTLKNKKGFGQKTIDKLLEIYHRGKIIKLEKLESNPRNIITKELTNIFGVGPKIANLWYQKGIRNMNELYPINKFKDIIKLTNPQKKGIYYYNDILQRIPRNEITAIANYINKIAQKLWKGVILTCCGSYRRGKSTSGDVDILLHHPNSDTTEEDTHKRHTFF